MENIVCKACGGSVKRVGNSYVCDFCGSHWPIDVSNDVRAVERAYAWETLRNNDFEKAVELFENIILKDGSNHEAYWGRALALNGIVYVTDYNENKKVPTCNNITEESFLENKDVQKAISLAPLDIKESYKKQAEQIEKIRKEWLNKASKEPPYDVFISFKDSDREHGIERTQDSIDVQDLYTALVQKGYNVFFSRVTLRNKVSEQYEPYIYNAIKTAKVMIVFGEKAEYFNAVWIKNEWSRFKTRIEKGEKHKNSLIVVYKNVSPSDITPSLIGGRQAIDYSIPSNYEVLMNHIKRVIDESNQAVHLDRIEIKGGQISKKSSQIKTETIKVRELGKGVKAQTDIDTEQKLTLVYTYIKSGLWNDAKEFLDDVLFDNPTSAKAHVLKLFLKYQILTGAQLELKKLFSYVDRFSSEDIDVVNHAISIADKTLAEDILNAIYLTNNFFENEQYLKLLKIILPYNYSEREAHIKDLFESAIEKEAFKTFSLLLTTLNSVDVDSYINYNIAFSKNTRVHEYRKSCAQNVLSVQEGNTDALKIVLQEQVENCDDGAKDTLENLLKYSNDIKYEVKTALSIIINCQEFSEYHCKMAKTVLKYYPGELVEIEKELNNLAKVMLENAFFDYAENICLLIVGFNKNSQTAYWCLCLCKINARNEQEVLNSDIPIRSIPEFKKYLTLTSEEERLSALDLSKIQEDKIRERQAEVEEKNQEIKAREERKIARDTRAGNKVIWLTVFSFILLGLLTFLRCIGAEEWLLRYYIPACSLNEFIIFEYMSVHGAYLLANILWIILMCIMLIIAIIIVAKTVFKDGFDFYALVGILIFLGPIVGGLIFGLSRVIITGFSYVFYFLFTTGGTIIIGVALLIVMLLISGNIYIRESKIKRIVCFLLVAVFTLSGVLINEFSTIEAEDWIEVNYEKGYLKREDNYIYFGSYPQTVKEESVTVGEIPNENGYYMGDDGEQYAKVTATPYRADCKFSNSEEIINGKEYYFKVEPIKWRIWFEEKANNAFYKDYMYLLCDSIIETRIYDDNSDYYETSVIRSWLNNQFYNIAFNSTQQKIISGGNPFKEQATEKDLVTLFKEYSNHRINDEDLIRKPSDYSIAQGNPVKNGAGLWWSLTYNCSNVSGCAEYVYYDGEDEYNTNWDYIKGVVPVIKLCLN